MGYDQCENSTCFAMQALLPQWNPFIFLLKCNSLLPTGYLVFKFVSWLEREMQLLRWSSQANRPQESRIAQPSAVPPEGCLGHHSAARKWAPEEQTLELHPGPYVKPTQQKKWVQLMQYKHMNNLCNNDLRQKKFSFFTQTILNCSRWQDFSLCLTRFYNLSA